MYVRTYAPPLYSSVWLTVVKIIIYINCSFLFLFVCVLYYVLLLCS